MIDKELKQRAEESFKKRLGTLGYTMVQNSINPYVDGYKDGYKEGYNDYKTLQEKVALSVVEVKDPTTTPIGRAYRVGSNDKLDKAKEIIKNLMYTPRECISWYDLCSKAEQFLKEE